MIIALNENELEEQFERSSGPGGQNVNKVATKVLLRHVPTGISVAVQDRRSQSENRKLARERLLEALQNRDRERELQRRDARERERRRKRQRPAGVKARILESKRHRSKIKSDRKGKWD